MSNKWKCPNCKEWREEVMARLCAACRCQCGRAECGCKTVCSRAALLVRDGKHLCGRCAGIPQGYAWLITKDHGADANEPVGSNCNSVGVIGPSGVALVADDITFLPHTEFRMYDDDGELYYEGVFVGDSHSERAFGPLEDFGAPNAGCTRIDYKREGGAWSTL